MAFKDSIAFSCTLKSFIIPYKLKKIKSYSKHFENLVLSLEQWRTIDNSKEELDLVLPVYVILKEIQIKRNEKRF